MRNLKFILTALLATPLLLLGGCGDDNDGTGSDGPVLGKTKVDITTTIATRAMDNAWENGDEIGIYMMEDNQPVSTTNIYSNKRYVTTATTATGAFAPPSGDEPMYFPTENAEVGFVAYYPYSSTVGADNTVEIDVETQTDLSAIDFMVASRVTASEDSPTVNLDFHHRLSKLIIEVENASEVPATALNVTLIGLKTKSSYSISNDVLADNDTSVKDIAVPMVQDGTDTDLFAGEAIILPAGTVSASINFEFPGGNSYTWNFDATQLFERGLKYAFQFKLNKDDVVLVSPDVGGTVNDWEDGVSQGPIDLTPSGTGSQSSPFSISEAVNNIGASDKWVKGYIISVADNTVTRGVAAADVRFLIGENATETDQSKMALVKITDEDIAAWYDFSVNETELIGTAVKVVGTFAAGTSVALTVDNVTENVGGIDPGTGGTITPIKTVTAAWLEDEPVAEGTVIKGQVVSDGANDNLSFGTVVLVDGTEAGSGICLYGMAKDDYAIGTTLEIDLSGATYTQYGGLEQVTVTAANAITVGDVIAPTPVTVTNPADLATYISMLVTIPDAQAVNTAGKMSGAVTFVTGSTEFTTYNRPAGLVAQSDKPTGKGSITGTVSVNFGTYQLVPRNASDFSAMTGTRDGSISYGTPVFSATKATVGEALVGAKITVPFNNNPTAVAAAPVVVNELNGLGAINTTKAMVQGDGSIEIEIDGTPTTAGDFTFNFTVNGVALTADATFNPAGTGSETVIYTTGFESTEGFTAGTSYNSTTPKLDGEAGKQWSTVYGTASTTSPINGDMSIQMRWYTSATTTFGYTQMEFDLADVTKVEFYAVNTSGMKVTASYSTNGGTSWTGDEVFALATSSAKYTYVLNSTGVAQARIKFTVTIADTVPGGTSRVYLDDITIYGLQ